MDKIGYFIKTLRPHQWYKNLVVFIGIIFARKIDVPLYWYDVLAVFVLLCAFSGIAYVVNDIIDAKKDAMHPDKRRRPIASGKIGKVEALLAASVLFAASSLWAYMLGETTFLSMMAFFALGLLYNIYLKNVFLVDIITISVLFVVRAIIGVIVINVEITPWLILCTFLLSLMLALGKRRKELQTLGEDPHSHRKVLKYYSLEVINPLVIATLSMLFVAYCIYSVLTETGQNKGDMVITIPVMTYLLFRYAYLIFSGSDVASKPERVFLDKGMVLGMIFWLLLVLVSLYVL
jgi:4-hydroxybenzoate polyprenyltransferase